MKPGAADFFIGLDLGQKRDFSALAVVERLPGPSPEYHVRHLERLNPSTPYPVVAARARDLVAMTALQGKTELRCGRDRSGGARYIACPWPAPSGNHDYGWALDFGVGCSISTSPSGLS